jgi:hypothetical protein
MLEIKSYDDWTENQQELDEPATNLKKYTDYVRSSYYKAGQLTQANENEISAGVKDRLKGDGLISDDMSDEDKENVFSSIVGPKKNFDSDARFVLDHIRTKSEDSIAPDDVKASTLSRYLTLKNVSQSEAEGLKPYVDEILADKSLVKRARMSAADRGEYSVVALDEEDGKRTLYAGPSARPENLSNEVESLLATGALSSSDLYRVNELVKPINGGLSTVAKDERSKTFERAVSELAKGDKDINNIIQKSAASSLEEKTAALRTTGESIWEGTKKVVSYPFIKAAEFIVEDILDKGPEPSKYAEDTTLSDVLAGNTTINKRFTAAEIEEFSSALIDRAAGAPYRADRPETGIVTDSMGNTIIAPQLLYNAKEFDKSLNAAPLNAEQKRTAVTQRKVLSDASAPEMLKMVLEEDPDAAPLFAKAKADGLSTSEFLQNYVADSKNYDAFNQRLETFGKSAWETIASIPIGIAALSGNEAAAKELGKMLDGQARSREFAKLHGDQFGLGFELINTLPQIATDIGLTIGTGGAGLGIKALAKTATTSARSMLRGVAKTALSEVDEVAAATFREASAAGGEAALGRTFKEFGRSISTKFGENAPLAAVSFTRSASSAYGSIYNQLPDDMSHEEKHKAALAPALSMGLSTAVITTGMSLLNRSGVESVATNRIRAMLGGETDDAVIAAGNRVIPVDKMNFRQSKAVFENLENESIATTDKAFKAAMRSAIVGTYKNWAKTTLKGGLDESFEEALDQAVGNALEDAALDRETPIAEKVSQVFNAGFIGGAFGLGAAGATQFGTIKKSEQTLVFEGRASAIEKIANKLRETDSSMTADVLQRRIDEDKANAKMSFENDTAIQDALGKFQERVEGVNLGERDIEPYVWEQAQFGRALKQPVWDDATQKWVTLEQEQTAEQQAQAEAKGDRTLLADIIGERASYGDFDGVLEQGPDRTVYLRLDKPYGKKGEGQVEVINLGPMFQRASSLVSQEPTFKTVGTDTFGIPAGTPYTTIGRTKEKFAFPPKDTTTPEMFELMRDADGNVHTIKVNDTVSLNNGTVKIPAYVKGESKIAALARFYGLDITPVEKPYETSETGQTQFRFAEGEIKDNEELRIRTSEELEEENKQILDQIAPEPSDENQMSLDFGGTEVQRNTSILQRANVQEVLSRFDQDILSKQERLGSTDNEDAKKTLRKQIRAIQKAKKNYSDETILLGTTTATATTGTPTNKFRSWDEFRTQMDQEWSTAIDQIRTKYSEAFGTSNIEDLVFNTSTLEKDALGPLLGRMTSSDLDMVVAMSNEIVSYATDTNNTATDRARKETLERYSSLINRIETVQEWVAEQEYRNIYEELKELGFNVAVGNKSFDDIIAEEEAAATKAEEEAAAAEAAKPKLASDLDTLHYLLSTKPQEIRPQTTYKSVADVNPRTGQPTNRRNVPQVFGSVVLKSKDPNAAPVAVQIAEYNAETKQVFYRDADTNELVGVPIRAIDVAAPDMRQAIDAFNQEAYEPVAEQKRQARSTAARRSIPLEKRVASFINKVSNYATQVAELNTREKDLVSLPAARRSSVAKELSKQISALRSQATRFINQQGGILIQDMEWQKSLDEQLKQGTINSIREAIYGPEGYKSTSSRANVTLLRPESKIPTTKVILPKEVFRKGTQEETLVNELIQGGYDVNLPQLGQRLALNGMFETESGMMKYPAFSEATVELVEKEGDEVADANKYIKDKHVYLSEEVLKRFPQHGQFKFAVKAEKLRGKVASVGNAEATLESLEIELIGLKTKIENARISDAPVPDAIKNKAAVIEDQIKKMKSAIVDSRYYAVGNKRYRTQTSKQMEGFYFPIEEDTVRGETVTFGVFTNNPVITRAQIRAGYRIRIPDSFDMDNFNPSQHLSKDGGFVDGYYMPYEQEPYIVGTLVRTTNPNITEDGEQVMDLRVTENIARKELLVNRMVNPLKLKGAMSTFYASTLDSLYKRAELFLLKQAKDLNPRFPWSRLNIDNTITELGLSYAGYINEYRLAQNIVKKALGSLKWQHLVKEEKGSELVKRFVEEDSQVNYEYTYLQDEETKRSRLPEDFPSRVKVSPERRVVASFGQDITFSDLPASVRELVLTEEGNITDKIKQTNLVKFVTELMEGDVESIARDIKKVYNIKGSDPDAVIIEYARMLFIDATSFGGRFYSLPDYSSTKIFGEIRDIANKYSKQEQSVLGNLPLDVIEREGFDLSDLIGAAGNDVFQAMLDYRNAQQEKFGTLGADLLENSGSLDSSLRAPDLVYMDRASLLADELYKTVESDTTGAVGQAFRKIAESVGVTAKQMDYLSDSQVIQALANKLNTGYIFFKDRGAARIALSELSSTEAGKEAAGLLITRGWLPPVLVDGRPVPLRAPAERESTVAAADTGRTPDANLIEMARRELGDNATEDQLNRKAREYMNEEAIEAGRQLRKAEASTREIIDYSNQYMDAVNKLLPSIKAMSQIKSRELAGIEEARADIYDSYRMIRALVGAMSPEEGGMLHTKTKKEIAEGIELGAPFVTAKEVNNYLSRQVTEIEAEIAGLQAKRDKTEKLYTEEAPKIAARINEILNGTPDFTRDEAGRAVKVDGGGAPPLLETVKNKKERRTLLSELRKLQEKFTTISTYGMESMDSLDAAIEVKQKQLSKAEQRKNVATPVLLEELFTNISRAQNQIAMQRGFISRLSSTARNRIIEEQKMINRLSSLPAWKRYSQTITGLPVVAKQDPARSEKTERLIDALNESAAARQKLQEFADRERRELARTLIDNGVNLHNSGLLTTYVDPVDVETEEQVGEPVDLRFGEGEFSEAERAASTVESFGQATSEITLTGEERDRRTLEAANERFMDSYEENVARIEAAALRRKKPTKARTQGKMRKFDPNDDQSFSLSIIDPSLRDEARAENLKEVERLGLVSGDSNSVVNALKVIAKTGTERQKLIANLLSSAPDFIRNIRFGIVELDLGFAGLFDRSSNTVVVNLNEHNGRGLVDVLLHEYLHGSTVNVLLNPRTAAQRKAVARIEAIRNFAIANATRLGLDTDPVVQLGLNNNVEFLTYAFTAPEFQNILVGLTLPQQRTILRRIVDAILSVFGINPEVHTVAADAIQELFDFTKMSLAHSGTFSIDTKMKSFSDSAIRNKERALQYTDIESAERINDIIQRYNDGGFDTIFEARANAIPLTEKEHSRHAELESRKDNLTSEEIAEAKALVTKAAIKSSFNLGPLYHATWSEFKDPNKFDPSKGQLGTHFGSINQARDVYAMGRETGEKPRMYPSFIKALKPIRLEDTSEDWTLVHTQPAVSELLTEQEIKTIRSSTVNNNTKYDIVRNAIERNGYDSIVYLNRTEGIYNPSISYEEQRSPMSDKVFRSKFKDAEDSYIVFRPEQIKSAEPFTGVPLQERFNVSEQDIRYIQAGRAGVSPIDVLEEVRRIVPEGIEIEIDDQMVGAMGTRRSKPNTIFVNSNIVNEITSGLSKSNARSAVRSVVDEEVAHLASFKVFSDQDFIDITNEIGESMSNRVVDMLYSNLGLSFEEKQAKIAEDRESGALNSVTIGAEYVRGQMTLIAHGNTREQEIQFLYNNPTMMDKFLNAIKEFITMLKRRFKENPTVGTTAKISRASREFRRMRNGGVTPLVDKLTGKLFGDADDFLNALDGVQVEGNEDRTYYAMAVASTNPSKVATVWDKIQRKMYDSPLELKTHTDIRDGSINRVGATVRDFSKRWPKLRDSALNAGASMDELGKVLGTTAPAVQGQARTEIENKLRQFIKDNVGKDNLRQLVSEYEAKLVQPVNDKFYAQFRKEQKQTEDSLRARGFGEIVDYLVDFRKEINKGKEMIGFDESNDVYLTRTFKYFSTEGWAEATRNGGVIEIDGKTVDFNKMRAVAAKHYLREVELDAATEGLTLTEDQKNDLTLKKLDGYLDSLDKRAEETKQLGPMNTIKRDINRLLQKKDVDEPLRELLGEVTDPFENAIRTLYSVGRLAANDRFLKNFAAEAIRLDLANYKGGKDMEMVFSPKAEPELGDLAGLYFRKDIATIIKQELGPKARDHETKSMEFVNGIVRGMSKFSGLAITSQTLGSVGFYPRNILGGMMLLASNGIVNPVYARQAVKLSLAANLKSADSKETLDMIKRLTELQVINDETRGRIVMDLLRGFNASTDEQLDELMNDLVDAQATGKVDKLLKRLKVDKAKQVGLKVVDVLAAVNDTIDGAMKVHAYLYELDTLTKAFGDTEPTEKLEAMAARKVKLTLPTHSDQVSIVKTFNRSPLAMVAFPFARWKSEVIRTMINIVPLAMEEINSGNDIMRARGVKRLLGFSSVLLGGGTAFGLLFGTLFSLLAGGDDEEEKGLGRMLTDEELEVVKEGLPEWQRNHGLFARMSGNDGVQVIDLTNILPLSMSTDLVKLGMAGNVKGMAEYIAKEAVGAQIAATALYEVFNNKDDFGKAIASEADSAPVAAGKLTWHLLKGTMVPSVGKKLADITRYGQQDAVELVAGEITGARPRIHKRSDLEYTGMAKIKRAMDETQAILQPLSSGRGIDPADIGGVIDDHQASSNVVQKRLNEFTSTMMTLGSTEADILATANKLKISKQRIANAFAGTNSPWIPAKGWFKKMYDDKIRGGEQDPNEVANELFRVLPEKADGYSVTLY